MQLGKTRFCPASTDGQNMFQIDTEQWWSMLGFNLF